MPVNESPTTLAFTNDWQQFVVGTLAQGQSARIAYDSRRLPSERSDYNGVPMWSIKAFYRFGPDAPIQQAVLVVESAGQVPGPAQSVTDDSSFIYADIDVPADAQSLEMWFLNTGESTLQFWDSNYGQNYAFRFTASDIGQVLANIVTSTPTPYSGFDVQLDSVDLAVTSMTVNYRLTNVEPTVTGVGLTFDLNMLTVERGQAVWSGNTVVPLRANVIFTISYTVGNQTYVALNGGAGFTAIGEASTTTTDVPAATAVPATPAAPRLQV